MDFQLITHVLNAPLLITEVSYCIGPCFPIKSFSYAGSKPRSESVIALSVPENAI